MGNEKVITKYIVFEDDSHEYDLVVTKSTNKTKFELFHSDNPVWYEHVRKTLAFKIINTGNYFKLSKKMRKLDYSVSTYLRFILEFENKTSTNSAEKTQWRIINADNEIKI
jgi:hypothetical protein